MHIYNQHIFNVVADSNIWSSTLAGDLAQTALLKRKGQTYVGPDGYFNNTLCPTEFMLRISNQGITAFVYYSNTNFIDTQNDSYYH